jgi:integrase
MRAILDKSGQLEDTQDMAIAKPQPADPIRDLRHVRLIRDMLKGRGKREQYLLFVIGINTGLRVGDLLQLTYGDLWKGDGTPKNKIVKRTQKTGKLVKPVINQSIREAMEYARGSEDVSDKLSRLLFTVHPRTVSRWVKRWCHDVGLDNGDYSSHTLRKTFGYQLWTKHGRTDEAVLIVSRALGHKDTGVTRVYLGITQDQIEEWQSDLNL